MSFKGATKMLFHSFEISSGSLEGLYLSNLSGELIALISHRLWLAGVEALPNPMVEPGRPSKTLN